MHLYCILSLSRRSTTRRLARGSSFFSLLLLCALVVLGSFAVETAYAQQEDLVVDITRTSLEELGSISVTSVSKKEELLQEATAAIAILTQEDIQRAGVTTLPDALRLLPGVSVTQIDANKWGVSIRGFNAREANKLLVLFDGRSVYNPLFTGTLWETRDVALEDVERIEVIRGPGGSLWGANAVNGVINVITKSAAQTQGALVVGGAGTEERAFAMLRYGAALSETTHLRVYGKYFERDQGFLPESSPFEVNDETRMGRLGFRLDAILSEVDVLTVSGDAYTGTAGETLAGSGPSDLEHTGFNLLSRIEHAFALRSDLSFQAYFDRTEISGSSLLGEVRNTLDLDLQNRFPIGLRHDIIWGFGFRLNNDKITPLGIDFDPQARTTTLLSMFFQDEVNLLEDRLRLTLGSKLEHNDYSGFEVQPSIRLGFVPNRQHTFWASVSRAVRTPSRFESDLFLNTPDVFFVGNPHLGAEDLTAYELGYRVQPSDRVFFDLALFYHDYANLILFDLVNLTFNNAGTGQTYGAEMAGKFQAQPWWRLEAAYTFLEMDVASVAADPRHRLSLRSSMEVTRTVAFDAGFRALAAPPGNADAVPAYAVVDLRLAWHPIEPLELSVVARNLPRRRHVEPGGSISGIISTEVERGVYGKLVWRLP